MPPRGKSVFGPTAGLMGGTYNKVKRPFCLPNELSAHNLHESIRYDAIDYFIARRIPWHDGLPNVNPKTGDRAKSGNPSNHVCCSQSQCGNALFPFRRDSDALKRLLGNIGFEVAECLPILGDHGEHDTFLGFEWIGAHNYLMEFATDPHGLTQTFYPSDPSILRRCSGFPTSSGLSARSDKNSHRFARKE